MIRINKNLLLFSGLFLFAGTILLLVTEKLFPLVSHVTYYCQSFINTNMTPIPYFFSVIPIAVLSILIAVSFIKLFTLLFKAHLIKRNLKREIIAENNIKKIIKNAGLEKQTIIVKSNRKFAFCLGFRSPKIYLSTGLISSLSLREVEAVILHEQYHLENQDTLILIIASVTHFLFPFFPSLSDLIKKYRIEREIAADKFSISRTGDTYALVSALRKFLAFPKFENLAFAAIADHDTLEPRIYSLINKPYNSRQFRFKYLLITIFSSLVIGVIFISPIYAEEIHRDNQDILMLCNNGKCANSCTSEKNLNKLHSDIPNSSKIHVENSSQPYTPAQ